MPLWVLYCRSRRASAETDENRNISRCSKTKSGVMAAARAVACNKCNACWADFECQETVGCGGLSTAMPGKTTSKTFQWGRRRFKYSTAILWECSYAFVCLKTIFHAVLSTLLDKEAYGMEPMLVCPNSNYLWAVRTLKLSLNQKHVGFILLSYIPIRLELGQGWDPTMALGGLSCLPHVLPRFGLECKEYCKCIHASSQPCS